MKKILITIALLLSTVNQSFAETQCPVVEAYYAGDWSQPAYTIDKIPYDKLTHIIPTFLLFNNDGSLRDNHVDNIISSMTAQAHSSGAKVLIGVGGGAINGDFRALANSPTGVTNFVNNLVNYVDNNNLDGLSLDWEHWSVNAYPKASDTGGPEKIALRQKESGQLLDLLSKIKTALADRFGENAKEVVFPVFAGSWFGPNYTPAMELYVDRIHAMLYDQAGQWPSSPIKHHADLDLVKTALTSGGENINGKYSIKNTVIGLPMYGVSYVGGANTTVTKDDYYNIVSSTVIGKAVDVESGHPLGHLNSDGNRMFWETPKLIAEKSSYAKQNNYSGVLIWDLRQDTLQEAYSLMSAVNSKLPIDRNCSTNTGEGLVLPARSGESIVLSLSSEFPVKASFTNATRAEFKILNYEGGTTLDSIELQGSGIFESNFVVNASLNPGQDYILEASGYRADGTLVGQESASILFGQVWPPLLEITSISNGDTVSGNNANSKSLHTTPIDINFLDGGGSVKRVEFYINDILHHADASAPFQFDWHPYANGSTTVKAVAYRGYNDIESLISGSSEVTVQVVAGPTAPCAPSDINAGNHPEWSSSESYSQNDLVSYMDLVWKARWWTSGNEPLGASVWKLESDASVPWQSTKSYYQGDRVTHGGKSYQSNYWHSGVVPSPTANEWSDLGAQDCQ